MQLVAVPLLPQLATVHCSWWQSPCVGSTAGGSPSHLVAVPHAAAVQVAVPPPLLQVAAFHSRFCHSLGNFVPAPCPTQPGPLSHSFPWCCCSSFCVAAAGCQSPTFLPTINLTEEQLQKKCCPAHNKLLPLFWMEQPCPEVLLWMKMTIGPSLWMV